MWFLVQQERRLGRNQSKRVKGLDKAINKVSIFSFGLDFTCAPGKLKN